MSEFLNHQFEIQGNGPSAEITGELSVEIHNRLLASAIWAEPLTKYTSATHLAVALVNPDGELIGSVFNAQPLWLYWQSARTLRDAVRFLFQPEAPAHALETH